MTWIVTRPYPDGRRRVHHGDNYLHEQCLPDADGKSFWGAGSAVSVGLTLCGRMTLDAAILQAAAWITPATTSPLVVNWWTDMDIRGLLRNLANATSVDVYGQRDEHAMTRDELVQELRSICQIIVEADIQPVEFVGDP
jgi:hypothetical protein